MRYRSRSFGGRKARKPDPYKPTLLRNAQPLAYLVRLHHSMYIPPEVARLDISQWPSYSMTLPKGVNSLDAGSVVLASIKSGRLAFTPMPPSAEPQGSICYNFKAPTDAVTLARISGFVIFVTSSQFLLRSNRFQALGLLTQALSELDLAITLSAQSACADSSAVSDSLERAYRRYGMLRNKSLYNDSDAEAKLAAELALSAGKRVLMLLNSSAVGG